MERGEVWGGDVFAPQQIFGFFLCEKKCFGAIRTLNLKSNTSWLSFLLSLRVRARAPSALAYNYASVCPLPREPAGGFWIRQSVHPIINRRYTNYHYRADNFPRQIFGQIPRASPQNSAAHRGKIVQIPRLTTAICLWVSWALSSQKTLVIESWRCAQLC